MLENFNEYIKYIFSFDAIASLSTGPKISLR